MASPNTCRPTSRSMAMGVRKIPKDWRMPIARIRHTTPVAITSFAARDMKSVLCASPWESVMIDSCVSGPTMRVSANSSRHPNERQIACGCKSFSRATQWLVLGGAAMPLPGAPGAAVRELHSHGWRMAGDGGRRGEQARPGETGRGLLSGAEGSRGLRIRTRHDRPRHDQRQGGRPQVPEDPRRSPQEAGKRVPRRALL
jgi:hypothetical protein